MAARRPPRQIRPPQRFGWDDEVFMDSDSEEESSDEESVQSSPESSSDEDSQADIHVDVDADADHAAGWRNVDGPPAIPPFIGQPGIQQGQLQGNDPLDYFKAFLDDNFFSLLATETNRYAAQVMAGGQLSANSRALRWQDTSRAEMKLFVAILFAMGLDDRPTYSSYWSTDPIYTNPFFSSLMSRDRFLLLLKYFHVTDNEARRAGGDVPQDKLWKIRPMIALLNRRFQEIYYPEKDVCIDETMVPWTGRLAFKQYIPIKPDKYGIKLYQLCESSTGYTYNFKVYTGKEGDRPDCNHTMNVVMELMTPLLGNGHLLWIDNYYSGIPLVDTLRRQDTLCAGTLRTCRQGVPLAIRNTKLAKHQVVYRRRGNLLALKWHDKKDVAFLSTAHTSELVNGRHLNANGQPIQVPAIKKAYDRCMNGVDKNDQNVGQYAARRKSTKWYKKLVFHFFDLVRFQSFLVYSKATASPVDQLHYIQELIHSLVEDADLPPVPAGRPRTGAPLQRLSARHFPALLPPTEKKANATKRCCVCSVPTGNRRQQGVAAPRRKETRFWCEVCAVPLCVVPCFRLYHTHTDYRQAFDNTM